MDHLELYGAPRAWLWLTLGAITLAVPALIRGFLPYFKEVLVATLYHAGKLSEKEACLTLGISRRAFEELLPRFGFSVLADTSETIDVELHA